MLKKLIIISASIAAVAATAFTALIVSKKRSCKDGICGESKNTD